MTPKLPILPHWRKWPAGKNDWKVWTYHVFSCPPIRGGEGGASCFLKNSSGGQLKSSHEGRSTVGRTWGGRGSGESRSGLLVWMLEFFHFTKLKLSLSAEFQNCHNLWKDMAECVEERGQYVLHNIQALFAMWMVRCWRRDFKSTGRLYRKLFNLLCSSLFKIMSAVKQWNLLNELLLCWEGFGVSLTAWRCYIILHIQVHSNKGTVLSCLIWNSYYVKSIR